MNAIQLSLQIILMVTVGIFAYRAKIIKGDFDKQLTAFVMKLALPCLIINSMRVPFSLEELKNCVQLIVLSVIMWLISFIMGQVFYHLSGKSSTGRIIRFSVLYTNFTFMGLPIMQTLYGDHAVFYFMIFVVPYRIFYYSTAEALLSPPTLVREKRTLKETIKGWLSPPLIAVIIGLFLYITQLQLPAPIGGTITSLGGCASPLGMILCGISIAKFEFKKLLKPKYFWLPLLRNLFLPVIFLVMAMVLNLDAEMARIIVMFVALPVGSLLATFMIQYDPDEAARFEAAATVLLSTLFAAGTIPLWALILDHFFPV
ncbi:MAG: AEC family transporter [Clostridiales bacterium]|nr:AEC family transporter [Clostridiales bacterium]